METIVEFSWFYATATNMGGSSWEFIIFNDERYINSIVTVNENELDNIVEIGERILYRHRKFGRIKSFKLIY